MGDMIVCCTFSLARSMLRYSLVLSNRGRLRMQVQCGRTGAEFGDVGFKRFAFAARHLHLTRPCHVRLRQSVIA